MIMQGISAGTQAIDILHRELSGEICGVYTSSCYCLLNNNEMLLFHDESYGIVPFGIALCGAGKIIHTAGLQTGMRIYCSNSCIFIPDADVIVSLKNTEPPRSFMKYDDGIALEPVIHSNLDEVMETLKVNGSKAGLGGMALVMDNLFMKTGTQTVQELNYFCRQGFKPLRNLLRAVSAGLQQDICIALEGLIGLGPGLTPSMDDVLVGLVLTLDFMHKRHFAVSAGYCFLKEQILKEMQLKTTLVSAEYLKCAARGEYFSILDDVIGGILCAHQRQNLKAFVNRLLSVGSSSGTDMLVGIVLGIKFLLGFGDLGKKREV